MTKSEIVEIFLLSLIFMIIFCRSKYAYFTMAYWNYNHFFSRHFLLKNGSLLIVRTESADSGVYQCKATNQFVKKSTLTSTAKLTVLSRLSNDAIQSDGNKLLPRLQNSSLKIESGQTLVLHCASNKNKVSSSRVFPHITSLSSHWFMIKFNSRLFRQISWTFTPRNNGSTPIPLNKTANVNEVKYVNAAVDKHDGIYNCSTETDFQVSISKTLNIFSKKIVAISETFAPSMSVGDRRS